MGTGPPSARAPQTIWAVRSTSAVMCKTLSGRGPTATSPWLAISAAPRPSSALTALAPTSGVPDVATAIDGELVDARRNRRVRDGEDGRVHGVTMDDATDVVERLVTRQVQLHLRRRVPPVFGLQHAAVGVDQHEVVERHLGVVDRRRRDDDVAVG